MWGKSLPEWDYSAGHYPEGEGRQGTPWGKARLKRHYMTRWFCWNEGTSKFGGKKHTILHDLLICLFYSFSNITGKSQNIQVYNNNYIQLSLMFCQISVILKTKPSYVLFNLIVAFLIVKISRYNVFYFIICHLVL